MAWTRSESPGFGQPLSTAIEELFHNTTLSLFSNKGYLRKHWEAVDMATAKAEVIDIYKPERLLRS